MSSPTLFHRFSDSPVYLKRVYSCPLPTAVITGIGMHTRNLPFHKTGAYSPYEHSLSTFIWSFPVLRYVGETNKYIFSKIRLSSLSNSNGTMQKSNIRKKVRTSPYSNSTEVRPSTRK